MRPLPFQKRTIALLAVLVPLSALFAFVALRSGPLAPVPVAVATVEDKSLSPALFGIGTVEARHTYKIGPTSAGRVKRLDVDVGDRVHSGQVLGEMDPVDLDDRLRAQDAALQRAKALVGEAQARKDHARAQADRYERAWQGRATSAEQVATKQQELSIAEADLQAARHDLIRVTAEREAAAVQRRDLRLIAPVDGLIVARDADPGTTLVAGQPVVQMIDPKSIWINVRFDQIHAHGLAAGLPTRIVLRSQRGAFQAGRLLRVEPLADTVTEETLAKVVFERIPDPLPPVGELAEVTVELPALPPGPVIPNSAIQRRGNRLGVWQVTGGDLRFQPVDLGKSDLNGTVQVREGLAPGEKVVAYSRKGLNARSRIHVVDRLPGVMP